MPSSISVRCAASIQSCTVFLGVRPTMSLLFSCLGAREYAYAAFGLFMPFFHRKTRQASIIAWKRCPVCSRRRRTGGANRTGFGQYPQINRQHRTATRRRYRSIATIEVGSACGGEGREPEGERGGGTE